MLRALGNLSHPAGAIAKFAHHRGIVTIRWPTGDAAIEGATILSAGIQPML